MMHVLLESAAPAPRRLVSWTSASVAAHGAVVGLALWVTLAPEIATSAPPRAEDVVYVRPDVQAQRVERPIVRNASIPRLGAITIPAVAAQRITFPDVIPSVASSADFPATILFGDRGGTSTDPASDRPFESSQVERVVRPRPGNPTPAYPSQLRSANVEGNVLVRFVVDTLGRVEPSSVEVRGYTHALFADAVREWLRRTRYDPATIADQPVRQLVEQRVGFTVRR
jgi:TonB family protein